MESDNIINANIAAQQAQQTSQSNNGNNSGLNGTAELASDFDSFLTLLTTQLQNQDPLEPMKSQEFTNQLVKFSEVEQALKTNDKLDELLTLQGDGQTNTAVSMIGKGVEAKSNQLRLEGDSATIGYNLDGNAEQATVLIADNNGEIVRSLEVSGQAGEHTVTWDGTDKDGQQLDPGVYAMQIQAVDAENKTVQGDTFAVNEVQGFEQRDGTIHLDLGGFEVALDDVKAVRALDAETET
jgi:flagellar basal-body rod modification protein FlgD